MGGALASGRGGTDRIGLTGVTRRVGLVAGAKSLENGSTEVFLEGIVPGEVGRESRGSLTGARVIGGRLAPPNGERPICGSGLVVLKGGKVDGRADSLPALTSSSDDV